MREQEQRLVAISPIVAPFVYRPFKLDDVELRRQFLHSVAVKDASLFLTIIVASHQRVARVATGWIVDLDATCGAYSLLAVNSTENVAASWAEPCSVLRFVLPKSWLRHSPRAPKRSRILICTGHPPI